MSYHVIVKHNFTVAALDDISEDWATHCPVLQFLQDAQKDTTTASSCKGYRALFLHYAQNGPAGLTTSMMHEANKQDAIMELIKGRLRILCFIEGDTIYLTNGYLKSTKKADTAEVARAVRAKEKFLESNPTRSKK